MKTIYKPWGREEWIELNNSYCYKRIYINAGYKTSYQYHVVKKETNYIISGTAEIWLENDSNIIEKKIFNENDFFTVYPLKKHRVIAITDVILQEVSTPEVNDVIRIEDDNDRQNGKIDKESDIPAVLILTAGKGTRLMDLTVNINKAMLPINNKAIISYIIEKFPKNYDFVIAIGYKGELLKEYCQIAHPDKNFIFVNIDNVDGYNSGPGYSALKCKSHLQRPFYFVTSDCIVDSKIPPIDGNWLGVYPTNYPEKYSTVKIDNQYNILNFINKNKNGFDNAFIGLASILDYETFWKELETNIENGEIVSAFNYPLNYHIFKTKQLKWFDTGNIDDLQITKQYFNDVPLSLYKITDEITYKENKLIKFNLNSNFIKNKTIRANILKELIPPNYNFSNYFLYYDWVPGKTLYDHNSIEIYRKFLDFYEELLSKSVMSISSKSVLENFYINKTHQRKQKFIDRFGNSYYTQEYIINGTKYNSMESILSNLNLDSLYENKMYDMFHGDLQFDNIIYDYDKNKFTYIDWRESFGGITECGDLYYDLSKLYGGSIINYNLVKNMSYINYEEGLSVINYSYDVTPNLILFKSDYIKWIIKNNFDLNKIELITALIFLNMSPLHDNNFGKMLWSKAIEMLTKYVNK